MNGKHFAAIGLIPILAIACAAPQARPAGPPSSDSPSSSSASRVPKRLVAAVNGEPTSIVERMNTAQVSIPGAGAIEQLANVGLSEADGEGKLHPALAEAVPSVENGLWKLLPDGRMETTWKIREGARWHDGVPVSAEDFVFTTAIDQDRDLPILARPVGYQSVERVDAVDARTVTVTWSKPYIEADTMFTQSFGSPLPRHLLEDAYTRDKGSLLALPYWGQDYVGTGPYAVRELAAGSHIVFQANDRYLHGRPKIDEIEVRFILDINVIITNIVAGTVELTLGRGFSIENALQLRNQWREGAVEVFPRAWIVVHPQFINPNPPVVADVRFRRALMHATDRESLHETLQGGLTAIAHVFVSPSEAEYKDVEDAVIRYEYDPRRAAQMIEELGYTKGQDAIFRDGANQRLAVEMRTYGLKVSDNATLIIAEAWTRFGVATEPVIVPPQRIQDREYMATFPAFLM